jgi:hypothetical protein
MVLFLTLTAGLVGAGEPPPKGPEGQGRPDRGRRDPGRRGRDRGGRFRGRGFPGIGRRGGADVFDAAEDALELTDETEAGVDQLQAQYRQELEAAIAELRAKMDQAYAAKILELLPEDRKPKYDAVAKALLECDEAIRAAEKTLEETLDAIKEKQGQPTAGENRRRFGPPRGQASKMDILRSHFVLSDEQQEKLDALRRETFGQMRERMRGLFRELRGGERNRNTFRRMRMAMEQVREEMDDTVATAAVEWLTDEQKADYEAACAAIDAFRKAEEEAEAACRKAVVEAVGEEKATELLGPPPGEALAPKAPGTEF